MSTINVENTAVQMKKGILEYCILTIISRGETYTSDMIEELTAAQMVVVEGTLYPLLTRLKNAGLLTYNWVESTGGPPRKYYKLTEQGESILAELKKTWEEIAAAVAKITSITQNTETNINEQENTEEL